MQGQPSHDQVILVASGVDTVPVANNVVLKVWVYVESRRKASKQSCCNPKGKEVIIAELVSAFNTYETPSPLVYAREVRSSSPPRTELLVANPCVREVQSTSPLRTDLLVAHTGCNNPTFQAQNNGIFFLYLTHIVLVIGEHIPSHYQDTIHTSTTVNLSFKSESYINP